MVGRRTQQTLAPASHVQGDSAAGTHSNLHDLASLTRWWTAAINKNMTRSLCHLNAENSFLPRCHVVTGRAVPSFTKIHHSDFCDSQAIYEFLAPDDEGTTILRNVRNYTPDDTARNFRKTES